MCDALRRPPSQIQNIAEMRERPSVVRIELDGPFALSDRAVVLLCPPVGEQHHHVSEGIVVVEGDALPGVLR